MAKKTYNVLTPVEFDHERFEVDTTINLEDKDATPLLAVKAIELAATQTPGAATAPTDPAERQAAIVSAIGELDPNNPDLWLKDNKPDTAAISAVLGWLVTAAERNAAWASIRAAA